MQASKVGPVIIASNTDPASLNISRNLINNHNFLPTDRDKPQPVTYSSKGVTMVVLEKDGIYARPEDLDLQPSSIIFASKHRSSTNTPALTVHATGNLGREALYGGNPEEVSFVEPFRIREALKTLKREAQDQEVRIEIIMEATHHGPTDFPVPVCFVEIGSGPEQWQNPVLGLIAAKAVVAASIVLRGNGTGAVGFGGTHYPDKLTRMCMDSDYEIGHVVPRRNFDLGVSETILRETFHKTAGICKTGVVDWKGLKGVQRRRLLDSLASWDVEVVRC